MPKSDDELRMSAEHLKYEWSMLLHTAAFLEQNADLRDVMPKGVYSGMLESFAVHARALVEFLCFDPSGKDYVRAHDFFSQPEQWTKSPMSPRVKTTLQMANEQIAHLTYARNSLTPEQRTWPFIEIREELRSVVESLLAAARPGSAILTDALVWCGAVSDQPLDSRLRLASAPPAKRAELDEWSKSTIATTTAHGRDYYSSMSAKTAPEEVTGGGFSIGGKTE